MSHFVQANLLGNHDAEVVSSEITSDGTGDIRTDAGREDRIPMEMFKIHGVLSTKDSRAALFLRALNIDHFHLHKSPALFPASLQS